MKPQSFETSVKNHLGEITVLCRTHSIEGALKLMVKSKRLPPANVALHISYVADLMAASSTELARLEIMAITKTEAIISGLKAITNPYEPSNYWMLKNVERDFAKSPERNFKIVATADGLEAWAKPVTKIIRSIYA